MRNGFTRGIAATVLLGALVLVLSSADSPLDVPAETRRATAVVASHQPAENASSARTATRAPASTSGEAALVALGPRLPAVARGYGWTAAELADTLRSDSTLHVDSNDRLFYVERPIDAATEAAALAAAAAPEAAAPFPLGDTFKLHSLPGAKLTILLDFDGATMSNNGWTTGTIIAPAWSLDGEANPGFNDTEKSAIQDIWRRVAEDYAPFNVDVTTEFTSEAVLTRTSLSDLNYGARVLISPISSYFGDFGGYAYLDVFAEVGDYYKPALVFPENIGNSTKSISEAASHEAGHNLGLNHDGSSVVGYYAGSGSGDTGWAPIMGNGYTRNLTQWSQGEYPDATNKQNDLAIIQGYIAYRADDAGDTTATAVVLPAAATLSTAGMVGASTDVDVYRFSADTGTTSIAVSPAALGPNLDVYAEIRRPDGSVVASSNPTALLSASFSTILPAGTYYLAVRGTGKLTPLDSGGYSNYASIGQYTVTGSVPYVVPVTIATPTPATAFTEWVSSDVTISLAASEPVYGIAWTRYSINSAGSVTYGGSPVVISAPGTTVFAYRSQSNGGAAETTKTATVRIDKVKPVTTILGLLGRYAVGGGNAITLSPTDGLSGVAGTWWRLGTSGAFISGITVPVPAGIGTYTLQYFSADAVGNSESVRTATVLVTEAPVTRVAGGNRYDTAVQLARKGWDPGNTLAWTGVKHIVVANGEPGREADPIGAAGLAGAYGAPVLLTQASRLPGSTKATIAEIAKANPGVRVHLIGSTSVVPDARWNDIKAIKGVSAVKHRVSGPTRYSTSAAIARAIVTQVGEHRVQGVLVVAVDNPAAFYDALAASPIAYARTMPLIGVKKSTLESSAMNVLGNELAGKPIYFANSDVFVTREMKRAISGSTSPTSLATSSDHYIAATQIAQAAVTRGWLSRADSGLAAKLPDALAGGTYLGLRGGVLLFTDSSAVIKPVTKSYLTTHKAEVTQGWVIGGTAVIPAAQETSFRNLLK